MYAFAVTFPFSSEIVLEVGFTASEGVNVSQFLGAHVFSFLVLSWGQLSIPPVCRGVKPCSSQRLWRPNGPALRLSLQHSSRLFPGGLRHLAASILCHGHPTVGSSSGSSAGSGWTRKRVSEKEHMSLGHTATPVFQLCAKEEKGTGLNAERSPQAEGCAGERYRTQTRPAVPASSVGRLCHSTRQPRSRQACLSRTGVLVTLLGACPLHHDSAVRAALILWLHHLSTRFRRLPWRGTLALPYAAAGKRHITPAHGPLVTTGHCCLSHCCCRP